MVTTCLFCLVWKDSGSFSYGKLAVINTLTLRATCSMHTTHTHTHTRERQREGGREGEIDQIHVPSQFSYHIYIPTTIVCVLLLGQFGTCV